MGRSHLLVDRNKFPSWAIMKLFCTIVRRSRQRQRLHQFMLENVACSYRRTIVHAEALCWLCLSRMVGHPICASLLIPSLSVRSARICLHAFANNFPEARKMGMLIVEGLKEEANVSSIIGRQYSASALSSHIATSIVRYGR